MLTDSRSVLERPRSSECPSDRSASAAESKEQGLKILLTGAYSTGKTTLAAALVQAVAELGIKASIRPDPARDCPLPLNTDQSFDASHWMVGSVLAGDALFSRGGSAVLICDRGLPDILSHTYGIAADVQDQASAFGVNPLTRLCADWLRTYDFVFRTKIDLEMPIVEDGLRVADRNYQLQMDSMLTRALGSTGAAYSWLPPTLPDRVNMIMGAISSNLE
jgi:predicted ATPase